MMIAGRGARRRAGLGPALAVRFRLSPKNLGHARRLGVCFIPSFMQDFGLTMEEETAEICTNTCMVDAKLIKNVPVLPTPKSNPVIPIQ
jgi:hypothetical protein